MAQPVKRRSTGWTFQVRFLARQDNSFLISSGANPASYLKDTGGWDDSLAGKTAGVRS
jgi:hypothetical protein